MWILALATNKNTQRKLFFLSIVNRCLIALYMTFKSFVVVSP